MTAPEKLIPPHHSHPYSWHMTPEPASATSYASLSIAQLIGLNLAKLYAWLVRYEATGQTVTPSDMTHQLISTEWLVHAFIRMLASEQLERAGFTFAAHAMRVPNCAREPSAQIERAQVCGSEPGSRGIPASTKNEAATPAECLARLEATTDQFERAEAIASNLARIIVLALLYMSPETRTPEAFAPPANHTRDAGRSPTTRSPMNRGPPCYWPPPHLLIACRSPEPPYWPGLPQTPRRRRCVSGS